MCTVTWGQHLPIFLTSETPWPIALDRQQTWRRSPELTLTNWTLTAQEALDWGIVTTVTPEGEALRRADELASQLVQGPTLAYGATKRLLHQGWSESLETQMMAESQGIAAGRVISMARSSV